LPATTENPVHVFCTFCTHARTHGKLLELSRVDTMSNDGLQTGFRSEGSKNGREFSGTDLVEAR